MDDFTRRVLSDLLQNRAFYRKDGTPKLDDLAGAVNQARELLWLDEVYWPALERYTRLLRALCPERCREQIFGTVLLDGKEQIEIIDDDLMLYLQECMDAHYTWKRELDYPFCNTLTEQDVAELNVHPAGQQIRMF